MPDVKDFYDEDAKKYDEKRFSENNWQDLVHQKLLQNFLNDIPSDSRILEIGCGTGRFTSTLVGNEFDTTTVDISHSMLQETRDRCKGLRTEAQPKLIQGDVSNLPFKNNYFDGCIIVNVLSHLPNPKKGFSEISRVVGKDGRVFTNFTNLFSPYFPIGFVVNRRGKSVQEDVFSHWYSWDEIDGIIANSNLEVERIRGHMIPPRGDYPGVDSIIKILDSITRDSFLRFFAGNRFYHLRVDHQ